METAPTKSDVTMGVYGAGQVPLECITLQHAVQLLRHHQRPQFDRGISRSCFLSH